MKLSKVLYRWRVRRRGKTRKSRSEEKVIGFNPTSLFPARKREAVTREDRSPTRKISQGAWKVVKGEIQPLYWFGLLVTKKKHDRGRITDPFT